MNLSLPKKILPFFIGLLFSVVMVACTATGGGTEPEVVETATTPSEPTTEPTVVPTSEPTVAPTDESIVEATAINGVHWSLIQTIVGGDAVVPVPTNLIAYLQIGDDGLVSGQSGCNSFSGEVTVEGNNLSFGPLATTRMACPEEQMAFEAEFLNLLSKVATYRVINGNLELQNSDGLPLALFAPATEQTLFVGPEQVDCVGVAPQQCLLIKEDPTAEYTFFYDTIVGFNWEAGYEYELQVNVVTLPNPLADASSLRYELVEIVNQTPVEAAEADTTALMGTVWQWIQYDDFGEGNSFEVDNPANYTIEFLADGNYQMKNDCNSGGGTYEADGTALTIQLGMATLVACGEDSLEQEFNNKLSQVASYVVKDGQLFLNLKVDSGNMVFRPTSLDG